MPSLSLQAHLSLLLRHLFASITIYFFQILTLLEDQQLSRTSMGLNNYQILGLYISGKPLRDHPDHRLNATLINPLLTYTYSFVLSVLFFLSNLPFILFILDSFESADTTTTTPKRSFYDESRQQH